MLGWWITCWTQDTHAQVWRRKAFPWNNNISSEQNGLKDIVSTSFQHFFNVFNPFFYVISMSFQPKINISMSFQGLFNKKIHISTLCAHRVVPTVGYSQIMWKHQSFPWPYSVILWRSVVNYGLSVIKDTYCNSWTPFECLLQINQFLFPLIMTGIENIYILTLSMRTHLCRKDNTWEGCGPCGSVGFEYKYWPLRLL